MPDLPANLSLLAAQKVEENIMLVSIEWLNEYVDLSKIGIDKITATLTDLGLEVEGVQAIAGIDSNIIIGEILTAEKHPNADSLQVCEVATGGEKLSIVCGAPNARQGIKVAVARVGTVLPGNFKIKQSKIRGIESSGMLCSEKELGISEEHDGILELDSSNASVGMAFKQFLDTQDHVLEIGITPNRSDCLSYIGIARDLAAKLGLKLKLPKLTKKLPAGDETLTAGAEIEHPDLCGRFFSQVITTNGFRPTSPAHKRRLTVSGIKPIHPLVDISNYVMLETGQPNHIYDRRQIAGNKLVARQANSGEELETLDGKQRTLRPGQIVICDGSNKIVALAGVMGGKNSEVSDDTTEVVVEVAHFNPQRIRLAAKDHGIHTEASHRFERNVDEHQISDVARRITLLVSERALNPSKVKVGLPVDNHQDPRANSRIAIRYSQARRILGLTVLPASRVNKALQALGLEKLDSTEERGVFEIPSFRRDLVREIDLIEEVGRIIGFDQIPSELPRLAASATIENPSIRFKEFCCQVAANSGLIEVKTFPFQSPSTLGDLGALAPTISLANPLNSKESFLPRTAAPQLLDSLKKNRHIHQFGTGLFQVSRYYGKLNDPLAQPYRPPIGRDSADRPVEMDLLTICLDQPDSKDSWRPQDRQPRDFYSAKSLTEKIGAALGLHLDYQKIVPSDYPFLHPRNSARVTAQDLIVGWIGELHPQVAHDEGFGSESPVLIEIYLDHLFQACEKEGRPAVKSIKNFPPATRDIAISVKRNLPYSDIRSAIDRFPGRKQLARWRLFDCYQGSGVREDQKSLAFALDFQSDQQTLTDKIVDKEMSALMEWLHQEVGAEQR